MKHFTCSRGEETIEAEDLDDLASKGWHVLYVDINSLEEGAETIECPYCFRRGMTISPSIADAPER